MIEEIVWLTGSRGFIGKPLVSELKNTFAKVICFTNQSLGENLSAEKNGCVYLDYSKPEYIKAQIEKTGTPDIFIHLGWGGMTDPTSKVHLEENVNEGKALVNKAFECGVGKFIFIGSMNEYGGRVGALSENMEPQGRVTNYAQGKTIVARYGFDLARKLNKTFIHLRPFYVYGSGQRRGSLINEVYNSFKNERVPSIGPCNQFRDYVHVLDVVKGILLSTNLNDSTTLNLGSGMYVEVKEFVSIFWDCLGGDRNKLKFGSLPVRSGEPDQPRSYADLKHLKESTGWTPERSLQDGIRLTVEKLDEIPLLD
jgi:nucleoside-diphosphate-sugar epimerase